MGAEEALDYHDSLIIGFAGKISLVLYVDYAVISGRACCGDKDGLAEFIRCSAYH